MSTIKRIYILTFTAESLPPDGLSSVVKIADDMLRKKNPVFARLMEEVPPGASLKVANVRYAGPLMHTPETMQTTFRGWLSKQYQVDFKPEINQNFFPHGMRDPQGRENFFLFYFEMA